MSTNSQVSGDDSQQNVDSEESIGFSVMGLTGVLGIFLLFAFFITDSTFGYGYLTAYNDPRLSEVASDYALDEIDDLIRSNPSFGDEGVELISIVQYPIQPMLFRSAQTALRISYRLDGELYDIETFEVDRSRSEASRVWIDMTEPEEIRISNSDYEGKQESQLRNYSKDIKSVIDTSVQIITEHLKDRHQWDEVFADSSPSNTKSEV